jgi:DNA-binding response OmpR family regulator
MLPLKDGFEIAKEIRKNEISTPIIFLTAKEDLQSKEIGFNVGGDDYLTKPFRLKELVLRVRNLTKRA